MRFVRKNGRILQNNKIHASCEVEDFVETHFFASCVRVGPNARVTGCVSSFRIHAGDTPF